MKTLYSEKDVKEHDYVMLIEYAMKKSDAFMLVYRSSGWRRRLSSKAKQINAALKPYRIKRRYDSQWPSTISMGKNYIVEVYRSDIKVLDILREPGSLFSWLPPYFPQDISFFYRNRCWFYTCAHENFLRIYYKDQEDDMFISPLLGDYKEEEDTSLADLYVEEYDV